MASSISSECEGRRRVSDRRVGQLTTTTERWLLLAVDIVAKHDLFQSGVD
jgi:hypothetical protein